MNYRHAYHAGNFADVFKHVILVRIIEYLKRKDGAFRVFDTHAGAGLYPLASSEAGKTGEWINGVGRMLNAQMDAAAEQTLAPYLDIVRSFIDAKDSGAYPGSPMIIRRLLRRQDRLSAYELHPDEANKLAQLYAGDFQVRVNRLDGWLVPGAHVPPKENRGLVLIDPPYEDIGDFDRVVEAIGKIHRRWAGGTVMAWYPLKHESAVAKFHRQIGESAWPKVLKVEMQQTEPNEERRLFGCGVIVKNPPYILEAELGTILPHLTQVLGTDSGRKASCGWIDVKGHPVDAR